MKNPNLTERYLLTNEVDVNLDVLRAAMLNQVTCHVNNTDVITEYNGCDREGTLKLEKKLLKPAALGDGMSHDTVLSIGTGAGHCGLTLGGPGHQVVAEVDTLARSGAASVGAASPICVRVHSEGGGRHGVELQTKVEGATDVAEYPLDEVEVWFPGSMHVETCLVNNMSNVRTGMCHVVESAKSTLSLAVLRRSVRAGHAKVDVVTCKELD
jgi:hypothetical protein